MGNSKNKMSISEMIQYSVILIKCHYKDGTMRITTGTIINLCPDKEAGMCAPALITSNHIIENSIKTVFLFYKSDSLGNPIDTEAFEYIYEGNTWIRHPDKDVDLRCFFLAKELDLIEKAGVNIFYMPLETDLIPSKQQLNLFSAMEDVFMIGYPNGFYDANYKPTIRKGITFSHPKNNYQGRKEILLDMGYSVGFSGSPVFILHYGTYNTSESMSIGTRLFLAGFYCDGLESDAEKINEVKDYSNATSLITEAPVNHSVAIKAERILEFEDMIN